MKPELTHMLLTEQLSYDPTTGHFRWRVVRTGRAVVGSLAGRICRLGYREIMILGRRWRSNRLAYFYMTGRWPDPGMDIDHRNGDRSDDRWINLRPSTRSQNRANSTAVGFSLERGKYRVRLRGRHLGYFGTPAEAEAAYRAAHAEMFGDFSPYSQAVLSATGAARPRREVAVARKGKAS